LGCRAGVAGLKEDFGNNDWGMFSASSCYQFNTSSAKAKPFVTGGYARSLATVSI
jgi:hypothetical protein